MAAYRGFPSLIFLPLLFISRNEFLWTPLDCAASKGHTRVIERLVNFKADIDPKDKQKTTPLHLAAKEGHVTAVETLIKHGACVSGRDYRGFNALDWAIENGHRFVHIKVYMEMSLA